MIFSCTSLFGYDGLSDINSLYVGERLKVDGKDIKRVEVSNKRVVRVSKSGADKTLTIEAKSKGNAVIYLWTKGEKEPKKHRFVVLSASAFKKTAGVREALKSIRGIKVSSASDSIYITGTVDKKEDYDLIDKLASSEKNIMNYVRMSGLGYNSEHSKISTSLVELGLYDVNIKQTQGIMIVEANARNKKTIEHGEYYLKTNYPGARIDLRLVPYQIDIDVKIVEVSSTQKRNLGLETPSAFALSRHTVLSNIEIDSVLHLYDGRGSAKILSNPSLSANDGETADFHVGGSIPIKLSSRYNSSLDWKNYGVLLNFTPKVVNEDVVELSISSEFSSLDGEASEGQTPGLLIRGVKTVVTMDSGKSVVISGLVSKNASRSTSGLPVVSDIPVLSDIFAYNNNSSENSELAVIVTPSIRLKCEELLIDKRLESLLVESLEEEAAI